VLYCPKQYNFVNRLESDLQYGTYKQNNREQNCSTVNSWRERIIMSKHLSSLYKTRAFVSLAVLLFSIVICNQNFASVSLVFADNGNGDKGKNQSLINDIGDKIGSSNISTDKATVQQILQTIQNQIVQISGQDKATHVLNLIDSILQLNPNGQLAQSLQYLAKRQALDGNTQAVQQAASRVASLVAAGGDNIEQALLSPQQQQQAALANTTTPNTTTPVTSPELTQPTITPSRSSQTNCVSGRPCVTTECINNEPCHTFQSDLNSILGKK
jgi:hypothetical protein